MLSVHFLTLHTLYFDYKQNNSYKQYNLQNLLYLHQILQNIKTISIIRNQIVILFVNMKILKIPNMIIDDMQIYNYQIQRYKMSWSKKAEGDLTKVMSYRTKLAQNLIQFNKQRMNQTYAFPSTLKQAQIHQIANTFGFNSLTDDKGNPSSVCPCCNLPINTKVLPIDEETTPDVRLNKLPEKEYKLSSGISLFFTFIKMAICYLILRFILTDSFNIISSAAAGTYCKNNSCNTFFTSEISSYNKIQQQNLVYALDILNLITIIFSMVFFNFYRKIQYKIQNLINDAQHTQDDYTLFLQNIPILLIDQNSDPDNITFDYADKLKKYFQDKIQDWILKINDKQPQSLQNIEREILKILKTKKGSELKKVTSITMCFDLSQMQVLNEMRTKLMEKYVNQRQKTSQNNNQLIQQDKQAQNFENILMQIKLVNHQELHLSQKFAEDSSMAFNLTHFVGRAFISFQYQHYRDYILRQFQRDKSFLKIRPDNPMKVSIASTPTQILWENMKIESATRRKSILISYFILFMVLAFAFGGTLLMTRLKFILSEANNKEADFFTFVLTILMTVVTLVINYILSVIVKQLTEYQKHQTKSNFVFSHIIKVVITQFINTSIIYYVSANIAQSPYLSEQGLVIQVSSLFLTSAVIQIILNFINPSAVIKQAKKYLKYRNKTEISMFQLDLNKDIEKAEFNVVDRYSYYILQIYACSFYSYLAPIATPCLIITFLVQYWIDKLNLLKRSTCKNQMDFALSRTMLKIFETSLFIFALGNFIFSIVLHNNYVNPVNIAALIISGLYSCFILFAPRYLQKKFFGSYEEIEIKAYSECLKQRLFKDQYWTTNPATKFVKEIDINTKQQVTQQQMVKFANMDQLRQAKLKLDTLLKDDEPILDQNFVSQPKMEQLVKQSVEKVPIHNNKQIVT